jgi:hypothetical protein
LWRASFKHILLYNNYVDHNMPSEKAFESYLLSNLSKELAYLDVLRYGY